VKVLLVDDSKTLISGLISVLKKNESLDIYTAHSKKECAQILLQEKGKFDIAILDLGLPDAPKGEVVSFIEKFNIPSIILTASEINKANPLYQKDFIIDYVIKNGSYALDYTAYVVNRFIENSKINVLIVDDSKTFSNKIQDLCKKYNINTIICSSGKDAMNLLAKKHNIKLILVDYNMPQMNGVEFTAKVRQKFNKDQISIIALSSTQDKEVVAKFLKYGANDFIYKDFSNEEFYARVNSNLDIIKMFETSRDRAEKDYLTGMYNRRFLFENGLKLYNNALDIKSNLTCGIIDIDKFKNINDTYGHDVGDIAIKHIPSILQQHLGEDNLLCRMGGEEFCIITKHLGEEEILDVYEKIRVSFEESILLVNDLKLKFTVSIGLTSSFENSFDDMLKKADTALYEAKETGRNKIVLLK